MPGFRICFKFLLIPRTKPCHGLGTRSESRYPCMALSFKVFALSFLKGIHFHLKHVYHYEPCLMPFKSRLKAACKPARQNFCDRLF